ncbi:methionine aminopeptidase 1D, chloroplastic/mitochondrial [Cephus cinctus]|uniref:Methionine aminopeptidase n=1 Tax=Cephus cinctus TaxID=211228 RepID=A0AAJ7FIQ1_CEPCN|nr:methionine aminopeptidase 1D, chloroplastic/mitochondrial [Cephus cinctus]XP_015593731.1 methionine aminopeptidase 1D, chloroplastic/mitochondrial [Cephus cinctus]XP_015593732.1 methionine aminopeptidase 1D, chloroplastic/mitochondrial [Cephus cinctus]XP_015593733.1 methionine aminopeptidase 1D, chloroplastic/mitochondrial [Cephus cinctus]
MLTKETTRAIQPVRTFFKNFFQKVPSPKVVDNLYGKYEVVRPWVVSEMNRVPSYIPQPSYSESSIPSDSPTASEIKDKNQIECMRHSCILAKKVLNQAGQFIKPAVTTDELDQKLHEMIINNCAYPSPLNYQGFPKSICTSINNVACHGIPDNRPLQEGDILNVDVTVYLNGYHGDCSTMYQVGEVDDEAKRLIKVTEECLRTAIDICKPNENFSSIGKITEEIANKHGFNIVPAFAGHGIGNYFHGPPEILHYANRYGGQMQPGMTFTIEPVLTQGGPQVEILEDGWTAVTVDDARTAQMEHTILITDTGCDILTY